MKEYRIITNGRKVKVQYEFLGIWIDAKRRNPGMSGGWTTQFPPDIEFARNWIAEQKTMEQNKDSCKWRVIE